MPRFSFLCFELLVHLCILCAFKRILWLSQSIRKFSLHDMRIKIHGTKNAYTTLRNDDVVIYELEFPREGCSKQLGVYKSDGLVLPLYCSSQETRLFRLQANGGLIAEELNKQEKLLRVISSDRQGTGYIVEEYIGDDVYVPLEERGDVGGKEASISPETGFSLQISLAEAELELAQIKLKLAKLSKNCIKHAMCTIDAPTPVGAYSQGVSAGGLQFVSGCIATTVSSGDLIAGGIEAQTLQCLRNMQAILGGPEGVRRLCKTNFYLTDMAHSGLVNRLYAEFLEHNGMEVLPARTTVGVNALPMQALIEIDAIALASV